MFGKISDDHGATYDFKVYEGETDAAGRAHGEGRWVYDQLQRLTKLYLLRCEFQDHLPKWRHVHWQYDGRQEARTGTTQIWGPRQITAVSMSFDQLLWAVQNDSVMGHLQNRGSHVVCVEGTYSNNQLSGPGAITYSGGDVLHCLFSEGYIQGPAKLFHHSKEGAHQLKMVGEKNPLATTHADCNQVHYFLGRVVQQRNALRFGVEFSHWRGIPRRSHGFDGVKTFQKC